MKSKTRYALLVFALTVIFLGIFASRSPWYGPFTEDLDIEWVENRFPETVDDDQILPFGYTLGPWPQFFYGQPIVMTMPFRPGPPKNFIPEMTQVWRPLEAELTLLGPHTVRKNWSAQKWKHCFTSPFSCIPARKALIDSILSRSGDTNLNSIVELKANWFDSLDPLGARGLHLKLIFETHTIHHYVVFTPMGVSQGFRLKGVRTLVGEDAHEILVKTLGGLKVKDELTSARDWIQRKIAAVVLSKVRRTQPTKARLTRLIQIQNWIFSLLSVNPTHLDSYFHLAGVTHLFAIELMKSSRQKNEVRFDHQEAWINHAQPLLNALIQYAKGFPDSEKAIQNMEALLQDYWIMEKRLIQGQ